MTDDVVARQRAQLCTLLESLTEEQWQAETLCGGWDAGDVAAHMLVRERSPLSAIGIVVPPLSGLADAGMARWKRKGREAMQQALRKGPTPWMRIGPLGDVQVGEDWIHAADVARGGAKALGELPAPTGAEDPEVADCLWGAVSRFAPLTLRGVDRDGVVGFTDGERTRAFRVGGRIARPAKGATPDVTVTGPVGDLVLYVTGRAGALVAIDGDIGLREALAAAERTV